jgi:hypothetical protein
MGNLKIFVEAMLPPLAAAYLRKVINQGDVMMLDLMEVNPNGELK